MMSCNKKPFQGKDALRRNFLALRYVLGAEAVRAKEETSDLFCRHLLETGSCDSDTVIAGYWPIRGEVDVLPLLGWAVGRGMKVALPVVVAPDVALQFRSWSPGDPVEKGLYGTFNPSSAAEAVQPRLILVPVLAFDRYGMRLGYGGGYYDRTLAVLGKTVGTVAVGVAYAGQEVRRLPVEDHDQPLDWVITEKEAIRMTLNQENCVNRRSCGSRRSASENVGKDNV